MKSNCSFYGSMLLQHAVEAHIEHHELLSA
jgi:hypothetical protein